MINQETKDIYEIGEHPPLGFIPNKMYAQTIRKDRFGEPLKSMKCEVVDVPDIDDDECLVLVMAAGINYNNIWAGLGKPVDVIKARKTSGGGDHDFHIGGSDASGIVYKIGANVDNIKVGDKVVLHCGTWSKDAADIKSGIDPILSTSNRIWGYETNFGGFAQFTKVQAHQVVPKPKQLSWEEAASYMLVGATAYRMLHNFFPNNVKKNDVVFVWGGSGGVGCQAIQLAKLAGARPIAVISDDSYTEHCLKLGAQGVINRKQYSHWGNIPDPSDSKSYSRWLAGVRKFRKQIWKILGERKNPDIVIEHPGESTLPTSAYIVERGGMVVTCGATTGYIGTLDIRYHWMHQKRFQGSHFANDEQSRKLNDLYREDKLEACLNKVFTFHDIPKAHQVMYENSHTAGNMAALVSAIDTNMGRE
ncbi:crotonyl-CoA carboxylase/reductase [Vibrio lentus]|uniref:crotonyl-CoA carboxylase/reductase n=1 Tax=Vibrio lentus TaxID=136468 RepID=UPI002468E8AE|nr:crotonyl-CoA carboxylase/reductase [Vibrio lentus]MDH5929579.1 crotonyl-CoA carboxylase/reductase [Vibrio lentus]